MKRTMNLVLGLFFGALVGVIVALLFTPQSGGELKQRLRERLQAIAEEARQAGANRRAEMAARYSITQPSPPETTA